MPRLISRQPLKEAAKFDLDEFKLWAKIDNDLEDELLRSLLEVASESFEGFTGHFLDECSFSYELKNERLITPLASEISVDKGVDVRSQNGVTVFSGTGQASFKAGFSKIPAVVKLWIFNTALDLYENRTNHAPKDGLIYSYTLKEF